MEPPDNDNEGAGGASGLPTANKKTVFQLICDGNRKNAVRLVGFSLAMLLGIYFISLWLLPCILSRIAAQTGGELQISAGKSGITLAVTSPRGKKTIRVINVPANVVLTRAIEIKEGEEVLISASGLVSTAPFSNWFGLLPGRATGSCQDAEIDHLDFVLTKLWAVGGDPRLRSAKSQFSRLPEKLLAKELVREILTREYRVNWRGPDGDHLYSLGRTMDQVDAQTGLAKDLHDFSKSHRLHPYEEWGCLVGYCCPIGECCGDRFPGLPQKWEAARENRTFKIGSYAKVRLREGRITVHGMNDELKWAPTNSKEGLSHVVLYLGVNDTILSEGDLDELIKKEQCHESAHYMTHRFQNQLCKLADNLEKGDRKQGWPHFRDSIWYMDNTGFFTVVIEQEHKRGTFSCLLGSDD